MPQQKASPGGRQATKKRPGCSTGVGGEALGALLMLGALARRRR
jgi:MYXO-CTERM domain-containing protein